MWKLLISLLVLSGCNPSHSSESEQVVDGRTWKKDPILSHLIEKGVKNNYDIKIAYERIRAAKAEHLSSQLKLLPTGSINAMAGHKEDIPYFNNFSSVNMDLQWEVNFFQGQKYSASKALVKAAEEDMKFVRIAIIGEIANTYIELRRLQNMCRLLKQKIGSFQDIYILSDMNFRAGLTTDFDRGQKQAVLLSYQSQIPAIEAKIAAKYHEINILLGGDSGNLSITHAVPELSIAHLNVGQMERRPDIQKLLFTFMAETKLKRAVIGQQLPQLTIGTALGYHNVFRDVRNVNAGVMLPFLQLGRIQAEIDLQDSRKKQAFYAYKKGLLSAYNEIESHLKSYQLIRQQELLVRKKVKRYESILKLAEGLYQKGLSSFSDVRQKEADLFDAQMELINVQAALAAEAIAVYKAVAY